MCHAILANYSRQLVRIKTPFRYYLAQDVSKQFTRVNTSSKFEHRILIYVTKTNLVSDVAKDVWAQNARSRELFERMMEEARQADVNSRSKFDYSKAGTSKTDENKKGKNVFSYAPFDKNVHVMSFKKFGNMLLGKNKEGRNFWAGKELADPDHLKPIQLQPGVQFSGKTPVPAAYWKDGEGNYHRGGRSHDFMQALINKDYNLSVKLLIKERLPATLERELRQALTELVAGSVNGFPLFKRLGAPGVPPLSSLKLTFSQKQLDVPAGTRKRPQNTVQLYIKTTGLQWTAGLLEKLSDKQWESFVGGIRSEVDTLFRRLLGPSSKPELAAEFPVFPPGAADKIGWRLEWVNPNRKVDYRWAPSDEGDYKEFNPMDRLVVVFDEGHLLFSPDNLLKAEESFDSELIIQAFRESNAVAYFASATVDVITGVRMGQALTPLSSYKGRKRARRDEDEEDEVDVFPTYEGDADTFLDEVESRKKELGAAMAGKIHVVDVSGMRDLFPDKLIAPELNLRYEINKAHAQLIRSRLDGSVARLMSTINIPFELQDRHKLFTSLFDPDRLLLDFFGAGNIYGFPLARVLLAAMRAGDLGKTIDQLSGRGILSSCLIDDIITALAGCMQALGYEWLYLIPNQLDALMPGQQRDTKRDARKRLLDKKLDVPLDLRTVQWDPAGPMTGKHASPEIIRQLGLEALQAVPTLIDNVLTPPRFIALSADLLVSRDEGTVLSDTASFATEALTKRDYALPFRVRNVQALRAFGASSRLLEQFRGTTKPVLHYYPANADAQARALASLAEPGALALLFSGGYQEPFFFIAGRDEGEQSYRRVSFFGAELDSPLLVDPASFTREQLQPVATEYLKMKDDFKSDARELIRRRYNSGVANMRAGNLRYLLISRQYGQGIDAFNTNEGYLVEPEPDPATGEQRVGRLVRLGAMSDQPYNEWVVRYHTCWADYGPDVDEEDKISGLSSPLGELLGPLKGDKDIQAVMVSLQADPLVALKARRSERFDPAKPLLPFQAVRVLTENPATTLRRAKLLKKTLHRWAIDRHYNRPERERESRPDKRVYSPTNYVLSSEAVVAYIRARLAELQPDHSEDEIDAILDFRSAKLPSLEQAGQRDLLTALLDEFNTPQTLPLLRRLAVREEDRTLSVSVAGRRRPVELADFRGPSNALPLAQLGLLLGQGIARFDPGFAFTPNARPPAAPKRAGKKKQPPAEEPPSKRQEVEVDDAATPDLMDIDAAMLSLPSSLYSLPTLVGAADSLGRRFIDVLQVHSIGTAVDRVAASDQEQLGIEQRAIERLRGLASELGLWSDDLIHRRVRAEDKPEWKTSEEELIARSVYESLRLKTKDGNPFRLHASVLSVLQYGVLSQDRALRVFASGFHSHKIEVLQALDSAARSRFMTSLGVRMGKLYQLALSEHSGVDSLQKLKALLGVDGSEAARADFIDLVHLLCCNVQGGAELDETARFFSACFESSQFGLKSRLKSMASFVKALLKSAQKNLQRRFSLVDVFELMTQLRPTGGKLMLRFEKSYQDLEDRFKSVVEVMRKAGTWDVKLAGQLVRPEELAERKIFADQLSRGRIDDSWAGLERGELFDRIVAEADSDWPVMRWIAQLQRRQTLGPAEARSRLRGLMLKAKTYSSFKQQYDALVARAPRPAGDPRPLLYLKSDEHDAALVEYSANESAYYWVSDGKSGRLDDPVQLLVDSLEGLYPRLVLQPEATAQQLMEDPLLLGLPAALRLHFSEFSSYFKRTLDQPDMVLELFRANLRDSNQLRVRVLRRLFQRTAISLSGFTALASSTFRVVRKLVPYLRVLRADSALPDVARLLEQRAAIESHSEPVLAASEILRKMDPTGSHFEELDTRVSTLTGLFSISDMEVRRLIYDGWKADSSRDLDQLATGTVPKIAAETAQFALAALGDLARKERSDVELEETPSREPIDPMELASEPEDAMQLDEAGSPSSELESEPAEQAPEEQEAEDPEKTDVSEESDLEEIAPVAPEEESPAESDGEEEDEELEEEDDDGSSIELSEQEESPAQPASPESSSDEVVEVTPAVPPKRPPPRPEFDEIITLDRRILPLDF